MGITSKNKHNNHHHITTTLSFLGVLVVLPLLAAVMVLPPDASAAAISCSAGVSGCHFSPTVKDGTGRNVPTGRFTGSHARHSGYSTGSKRQYLLACTACHPSSGYTNSHQSGYKNITGSSLPGNRYSAGKKIANTNSPSFGNCSNIYCHSTGRATGMGQLQYSSSKWGGTESCLGCHAGRASANGAPARSVGNFTLSTSHSQHLKYPAANMNCQICHAKTATDAATLKNFTGVQHHVNGVRDVTFTGIPYGTYTSYKSTEVGSSGNTKSCNNVSCHGGKSRGAWSATTINNDNTCVHCHGSATTSSALANTAANRKFFAPGYKASGVTGTSTDQNVSSNDLRVGSHFKHLSSVYMRAIKCNECHTVPSSPFDGTHMATQRYNSQTLTFSQASSATITIGVTAPSLPTRLATFAGYTNGTAVKAATCSSVYCHGSRLKTGDTSGTYRKPYWNYSAMVNYSDPANACSRCHGNPPTAGSSAGTHSGKAPTTSCSGCHNQVVNASGQIINKTLHINGQVNASGGHVFGYAGYKHYSVAGKTPWSGCTGCHTNGSNTTYPVARGTAPDCQGCHKYNGVGGLKTPSSTSSCYDCHGSSATSAQPNGAATAFPNWSGSHTAHTAQSYVCDDCHNNAGAGHASHGNYSGIAKTRANVTVAFNTAKSGTAATYASGTLSCSTSVCHGQKSPAWGAVVPAIQCFRCHGSQSASSLVGYTSATLAPGTGNMDTNRTTGVTARGGMHQEHLKGTMGIADKVRCVECHVTVTTVNQASHLNYTTATVTFSGHATDASHTSAAVSRAGGLITCNNTYCHTGTTNTGAAMAPVWNNSSYLTGTGGTGTLVMADCKQCHAMPPNPGTGSHAGLSTLTAFPIGTNCGSNCHTNLNTSATTYATIFNNKSLHINGVVEGGTCVSCHASVQGVRAAVVGQFASQSHHIQGSETLDNVACFKCHWEANSDGTINASYHGKSSTAGVSLVVWNGTTRPTTATMGTTYISYTANGSRDQVAKLNLHCLSCHNTANQAITPFGKYSTHRYSPEARLATAKAKTSIQSRYSSTRTVQWSYYSYSTATGGVSRFGTNQKFRVTKALSAHGNAVNNQMQGWSEAANGAGDDGNGADYTNNKSTRRNVFCFDCHNSHGSEATGITSSYSSATGRYKGGLLKTTKNLLGGYSVDYTPTARTISYKNYSTTATTSALFNAGAALCNDCHNTDTRKINISRPWSIIATYSSTKAIVGYWSTPYFDNYTVYPAKRSPYKAGGAVGGIKDLRKPMGGHYGSSVNGAQAGHTGEINGLCTPCHDPHGVSNALGADRDHGVPLLKGTWITSPYREDKADKIVKRGGGSNYTGMNNMGAIPGYHIDQNTFIPTAAALIKSGGAATATGKSNLRSQRFRAFNTLSSALTLHTETTPTAFAGICLECHTQQALTGSATNTTSAAWMSKERVHQSVAGWASTNGTNSANKLHAYTCSKCHAPHVSRLPRLLVTNCLDARHAGQFATGSTNQISTATATTNTFGNINQSIASSARGGGRFPGGGSRYSGTPGSAQNSGGWWFQTNGAGGTVQPTAVANAYGSNCHNATNAGGATWNPATQIWNKKSRW